MTNIDEPEFKNKFLINKGYKPYTCKKCGERFWSIIPRETCPDRPCSKYEFLTKDYSGIRKLALSEVRRKFIEFFKKHGHGYIEPYPVLARWRNDLYLTIASIIVFQPAVTEGIVDPPYNPLVIVQPSIRLEDIDEVGYTFGRHMTSFEMGGHHAFNKQDKHVYWVEETLEYAYKFFTEEIGIPSEDIVFKESWWEGGGNAGPAYEVLVDGLELATLVFMKYKLINGRREYNPVLVVDTGYGIERITWFTQKTPTAFHAVFGRLVDKYKDLLGVEEPPYDILREIVYKLSDQEFKSSKELEKLLEIHGYREYSGELVKSIALYNLLDHGKTISLMLSDGIVPSNAGEGYLARLVIRRMLKTLLLLDVPIHKLEETIVELLEKQASYWKGEYVYDKFHKHIDYILEVTRYETRKFIDAVERGLRIVEKTLKKKKMISIDDLVSIYDSHGIPPEIIAEHMEKYGVKIEVPHDFYSRIAARHGASGVLVKEKKLELSQEIIDWASKYPATKPLFHEKPYAREFMANILGVKDKYIILDKTLFYPKAGGQDHDTGVLVFNNNDSRKVVAVYKIGDVIIHELDDKPPISSGVVRGVIDWYRRYRLMRHHTATHIVLGAARRVLGEHVWQAGAEKTIEKARLDITHYKSLSKEEIKAIEREANRIIDEHLDLNIRYMEKFEAEKKYGLKIYEGGAVVSPIIRIVEIPGWDAEACFGTHVMNTSEVGGIKIINAEKIQDGVIRLEYIASTKLPEHISILEEKLDKINMLTSSKHGDPVIAVEKLVKNYKGLKNILAEYKAIIKQLVKDKALLSTREICGVSVVVLRKEISDKQLYKDLLEELSLRSNYIVILYDDKLMEIAGNPKVLNNKNIDLRRIIQYFREIGGKGGGKQDHIVVRIDNADKYIDKVLEVLEETCTAK